MEKFAELEKILSAAREIGENLQGDLDNVRKENETLKNAGDELREQNETLQKESHELRAEVENLRAEKNELLEANKTFVTNLSNLMRHFNGEFQKIFAEYVEKVHFTKEEISPAENDDDQSEEDGDSSVFNGIILSEGDEIIVEADDVLPATRENPATKKKMVYAAFYAEEHTGETKDDTDKRRGR